MFKLLKNQNNKYNTYELIHKISHTFTYFLVYSRENKIYSVVLLKYN